MKAFKTVWMCKWAALLTLVIEWLILLPAFVLLMKFGNQYVVADINATPIGSPEFLAVFFGAMKSSDGFSLGLMSFALLLPILLLTKLALTAGLTAQMQTGNVRLVGWFSDAGRLFWPALGLFLRWLVVPLVLVGLMALVTMLLPDDWTWVKTGLLLFGWLLSLSWFMHALNINVQRERLSLWRGGKSLFKNFVTVLGFMIIFALLLALCSGMNLLLGEHNLDASSGMWLGYVFSFLVALLVRFVVIYWQAVHVHWWQKTA